MTLLHWKRYAALGEPGAWTTRLAGILQGNATLRGTAFESVHIEAAPDVDSVVRVQVPRAIAARADLVSITIAAGSEANGPALERGVAHLRSVGCDVLLVTSPDPRFAAFNAQLWNIARTHAAVVLDLWGTQGLLLSPEGHRQLANRAAHALGIPYFESRSRRPTIDFEDGFQR